MKATLFFVLLFLSACSSRHPDDIPPFKKEAVCSDESLRYFKEANHTSHTQHSSEEEVHERMMDLELKIRRCYEAELATTNHFESFNLCLTFGHTAEGKLEFFEFSTKEFSLSKNMLACLNRLKRSDELKGLRDVNVIQPFRLFPRLD